MISDNPGLLLFHNSQEMCDDDALAAQCCLHIIANLIGLPFLLKLETAVMIPIHRVSFIHRAPYFPTFSRSILFSRAFPMFRCSQTLHFSSVIRSGLTLS